jgi:hypothetical protein
LLSKDSYEKFMREIEKQIDEADKEAKQKAGNILHAITDHCNAAIVETVASSSKWLSPNKAWERVIRSRMA